MSTSDEKLATKLHGTALLAAQDPALQSYVNVGRSTEHDAYCGGGKNFNGFYG